MLFGSPLRSVSPILLLLPVIMQGPAPGPNKQDAPAQNTPHKAAQPENPKVYAEPNPALPGQSVTIHWPAAYGRVSVSGGSLGARTEVNDRTSIQDRPSRTTAYRIERIRAGKKTSQPAEATLVHVHVYEGSFPRLATYLDTRGWSIDVVAGWNRYGTDLPDPANNELLFFQPEEDSLERLAVSIVPSDGMDSMQLMRKVETEIPTQYDMLTRTGLKATVQCGIPAAWMTFTGTEVSHPGTPSKSMVLAFVNGPRGYVISARTAASQFADREKLLRCLVRSFMFTERPAPVKRVNRAKNRPVPPT